MMSNQPRATRLSERGPTKSAQVSMTQTGERTDETSPMPYQSRTNSSAHIDERPTPERLLLTAREAAAMLGVSERHFRALDASGRVPTPVRLGRSVRWSRAELAEWVEAGTPARDRWLEMRGIRR